MPTLPQYALEAGKVYERQVMKVYELVIQDRLSFRTACDMAGITYGKFRDWLSEPENYAVIQAKIGAGAAEGLVTASMRIGEVIESLVADAIDTSTSTRDKALALNAITDTMVKLALLFGNLDKNSGVGKESRLVPFEPTFLNKIKVSGTLRVEQVVPPVVMESGK